MAHDHPHDHPHEHGQEVPSDPALRVKALESLLVEKGLVDPAALADLADLADLARSGPEEAMRIV
jgi:nitrile hydratase